MRNIVKYPITAEEVRQVIQYEIDEINGNGDIMKMRIGGIDGVIWHAILNVLDVEIEKDVTVMDLVLEKVNL